MAKTKMERPKSEAQWQAEALVRNTFEKTPAFKSAVREAKQQLKQAQKQVAKQIKGKK